MARIDRGRAHQAPTHGSAGGLSLLLAAPHRALFFSGVIQLLLWFLWWAVELAGRSLGWSSPAWPWPPGWLHGFAVIYGIGAFFIFGFLLTAMPRWQGLGDLPPGRFIGAWRLLLTGWLLFDGGLFLPLLQIPGLLLILAGWVRLLLVLYKVAFCPDGERLHPGLAWFSLVMGAVGIAGGLLFSLTGNPVWVRAGLNMGLWGFLLPVFAVVAHRMLPFFASAVIPRYELVRPAWAVMLLVLASQLHGLLAFAGQAELTWLADLPATLVAAWLVWRWQFWRGWSVPLLAMLQVGSLWLPVALALFAGQSLAAFSGYAILGLAPLHALGVGFFGVMLLAMVTRVTLGHSGRPLKADRLVWSLAWLLQLVAVSRMTADLWPGLAYVLLPAAACGWLAVFGTWAFRYLAIYLKPRADGRPG